MRYDVLIIGAGPAACAAALTFSKAGASFLLVTGKQLPYSPAGESLPPAVNPLLAELGVWEAFSATRPLASAGVISFWGSAHVTENDFLFNPFGCGWHIRRDCFDGMLLEAAARHGARICPARFLSAERHRSHWQTTLRTEKHDTRIESAFLLDASGRSGVLARQFAIERREYDRLIGIMLLGECPEGDSRLLIEAQDDGWWYAAPLPGAGIVVAFMTDANLFDLRPAGRTERWQERLAKTSAIRVRLSQVSLLPASRVFAAHTCIHSQIAGDHWLLTGDAAATCDPLSGAGVIYALRSGIAAAKAILEHWRGNTTALPAYAERQRLRFQQDLQRRRFYYSCERRWSSLPFWQRRQANAVPVSRRSKVPDPVRD
ncbi:MAG: tryptophan 7-halogenase [Verrucomicrobia bacterium]|nr:tryptophan 7-halogenase [Verrucomicrobiota bacterium]